MFAVYTKIAYKTQGRTVLQYTVNCNNIQETINGAALIKYWRLVTPPRTPRIQLNK